MRVPNGFVPCHVVSAFWRAPRRETRQWAVCDAGLIAALFAACLLLPAVSKAQSQDTVPPATGSVVAPAQRSSGFLLPRQTQRSITEIVPRQEGAKVVPRLLDAALAAPDKTNVLVSLSRQRVYLILDNEVVIDSPISSGRRGHETPTGDFRVRQKEEAHFSNIYGNYVDRNGRIVRSGISAKIDSAPSGTHFEGAPMRYFMRLTDSGVGMHIGILPGYAASHGCVRLPTDIAPLIYQRVKNGTPVRVED